MVIQLGELMMILELHRQGLSITAIARRTDRDPKTVRFFAAIRPESHLRAALQHAALGHAPELGQVRFPAIRDQPPGSSVRT
jgi:transposase